MHAESPAHWNKTEPCKICNRALMDLTLQDINGFAAVGHFGIWNFQASGEELWRQWIHGGGERDPADHSCGHRHNATRRRWE
jgi:hypothetical protein